MSSESVVHVHAHEHQALTVAPSKPAPGAKDLLKALARDAELRANLVTDEALRARMDETLRTTPDAGQQLEEWIERDRADTQAMLRAVRNELGALVERYPQLGRKLKRAALGHLCGRVSLFTAAGGLAVAFMMASPYGGATLMVPLLMLWSVAGMSPSTGPASPLEFAQDIRSRRLAWQSDDETFVRGFVNVAGRGDEYRERTAALVQRLTDEKGAERYRQLLASADVALERINKSEEQLAPWRLYQELEAGGPTS